MYNARAIRIQDTDGRGNYRIREGAIYIVETNNPSVGVGWTMQEDVARDIYQITDLQIDETKAATFDNLKDMNVIVISV